MQLVVVMAVRKAVSAATITFTATSMILPFFIMVILSFVGARLMGVKGVWGVKGFRELKELKELRELKTYVLQLQFLLLGESQGNHKGKLKGKDYCP